MQRNLFSGRPVVELARASRTALALWAAATTVLVLATAYCFLGYAMATSMAPLRNVSVAAQHECFWGLATIGCLVGDFIAAYFLARAYRGLRQSVQESSTSE